jgi:flagellar FliJ protein
MAEKRSKRMLLILHLAEREEQSAVDIVQKCRTHHSEAEQQLEQIREYQQEYLERINSKNTGLSAREMISDRQFIQQLASAEDAQLLTTSKARDVFDAAMAAWQQLYQRRKNIEDLIGRMRDTENQSDEKLLQKELDEFATQVAVRR